MIKMIIKKIFRFSKKILIPIFKKNFDKINMIFLKKKIYQNVLMNNVHSIIFLKLVLKYIQILDVHQYVAIGYLIEKIKNNKTKIISNPIKYLLPKQERILEVFFKNNISFADFNYYLGIGDYDKKLIYNKTINKLIKQTNNLNCNYFLTLLTKKKNFHYVKYTHGFWDNILRCSIKEYALAEGKELVMSENASLPYNIFTNNKFAENTFQLINSKKFVKMVNNKDIYFCATLANGGISTKTELKIMKNLSEKNILYDYSQLMILNHFSQHKEITPANIFKKIICTDNLREVFLDKIKHYDLVLICNHRAASKIQKIYPKFQKIYVLPDLFQDTKHLIYPTEFAKDVCKKIMIKGSTRPTLILSQAGILSSFISFIIQTKYKHKNISLIDIGKPLQTLFMPEISGGGHWRDKNKLLHRFHEMPHLISKSLFQELNEDTKVKTNIKNKLKADMDIERASTFQKPLF